jgi:hypothetical protein
MLRRSVPSELTFIRAVHRLARDLLVARGVDVTYRGVHGLIWREGDDVRTFVASLYNPRAGVVRLHVDHLSIRRPWKNETAHPTRNKSEISILPCEILAMLPWALGLSSVEPSIAIDGKGTWIEHREYAWSRRAAHTHDADVRNRRGRTA